MVFKIGPDDPTGPIVDWSWFWSDQLGRKMVRLELDRFNRWSDRRTGRFRGNRPLQLFFFFFFISSLLSFPSDGTLPATRWNPPSPSAGKTLLAGFPPPFKATLRPGRNTTNPPRARSSCLSEPLGNPAGTPYALTLEKPCRQAPHPPCKGTP